AVLGLLDSRAIHDHRPRDVDDDARPAWRRHTAAERPDEPNGRGAGLRWQLQHDFGQLDEYPVGGGEREDLEVDGASQPNDELGARTVALEGGLAAARSGRGARGRSRRQLLGRRRNWPRSSPRRCSQEQPAQSTAPRPAKAHVVDPRLTHYEGRDSVMDYPRNMAFSGNRRGRVMKR